MTPTATTSRSRSSQGEARVSDATVALGWRKKKNRRRFVLKIIVPLLVLVLVAALVWVVGFSSVFVVRTVAVSGIETLSRDAVVQTAQVPMGLPLARVDVGQITQRVESNRVGASARVERSWPTTVRIEVTERTPVFVVSQPGGYLLIDKTGFGYQLVGQRPDGLTVAELDAGNGQLLTEVAEVTGVLPDAIRAELQTVAASTPDSITLKLTKNRKVLWGNGDRSADKAAVLTALLKQKASTYDVSAPDNPAIRK